MRQAIINDLSERFSYAVTHDEEVNKVLNEASGYFANLGRICITGGGKPREASYALDKLEESFLLLRESLMRRLRDKALEAQNPKPEPSRIITPN